MKPGRPSLWSHFARESLFGNRGLTKAVMALLAWAVIRTFRDGEPGPAGNTAGFFLILFVVVCWIFVCILANDLADRAEDLAAGKRRWIARLPLPAAGFVVLALFSAGLAAVLASGAPVGAGIAYSAASTLGLLYSVRPFRFKRRGAWGILFYSLAGAAAYAVVPWAWMGASVGMLAALAPAVFLDKWVNVHFHQIIDHESDLRLGTRTYAVRAGAERARRALTLASGIAAVWFAGVIVYISTALPSPWKLVIPSTAVLVVLGSAYYAGTPKRMRQEGTPLVQKLSFYYLGTSYALFRAIPLILMVRLAFRHPALTAPAAAAILLVGIESLFVYSYRYE
jgi:4-hydroxybenzoate polyprenyltransferase